MTTIREALNEGLEKALRHYGADYGFVITDKSIKKLIGSGAFETMPAGGNGGKFLAEALMKSGKVLEQSDDECGYIAVVGAGVANMNHAFLALRLEGGRINIAAVAKEGLIKQGTATKAIERVAQHYREDE